MCVPYLTMFLCFASSTQMKMIQIKTTIMSITIMVINTAITTLLSLEPALSILPVDSGMIVDTGTAVDTG